MDFRDTLSALLPPPRDDDPPNLRQDILDELGDHLACAWNRELLRGADSSGAHQRVLDRFGDPAAVARRLWFDAMKGNIMAMRVLIATCLVMTLASLSVVGLVWIQSSRAAAQTAESNRQLSEALARANATNQDMLTKLSEMSEAIRNPRSLDWNPVKFLLTEETTDGPAAAGCSVILTQSDNHTSIERLSDTSGVADFGLVQPGNYSFQVSKRWDQGNLFGTGRVNVEPGSDVKKRIVCPNIGKKALERVRIRCDWPADLAKAGLVIVAPLFFKPIDKDGTSWTLYSGGVPANRSVLFGPGGPIKEILKPWGLYLWATSSPATPRADVLTADVRRINGPSDPLRWERGAYGLSELIVLRPLDSKAGTGGRQQFEILVRCYPWYSNHDTYEFRQEPPTEQELRAGRNALSGHITIGIEGLRLPKEPWSKVATSFDALPDRVNEWTINLPDELIKAVREKLKGRSSAP
jgi:hypothetical protein